MPKKDREKAESIVQREYMERLKKVCAERIREIEKALHAMQSTDPEKVLCSMPRAKQQVLKNVVIDDKEYARRWENRAYAGKAFPENYAEIYTDRGERVRSKTEKIIADKLCWEGIPYRYEHPVYLEGFGTVYPDFTLLNISTREEILLEHLGMMSDTSYAEKALRKIRQYEKNGYFVGKNLLLTYETATEPFDSRIFENMLKEMGFSGKSW